MKQIKQHSLKAWFLACRPKTLSAALIPVVTASALAFYDGKFQYREALLCVAFAATMQVVANFINDLFDYLKGTDGEERLGPQRACAQGWIFPRAMRWGIAIALCIAGFFGLALLLTSPAPWLLLGIGAACVLFAFLYTTLLSYYAMGDLLVWVFFGPVPVAGTYFVQAGNVTQDVWWLSAACGLLIDTLLVVNNYRDRDTDRTAGKRTLIVVLGEKFGRYFYLFQGFAAYLCIALVALRSNLWLAILPMFYLLPHYLTWRKMVQINHGKSLNRILGFTSRNMLMMGALIAIAFVLGKLGV